MKSMLDWALELVGRGFHVVPIYPIRNGQCSCRRGGDGCSPGKHPSIKEWQGGGLGTEADVRAHWRRRKQDGVGIACGRHSGVWVLDIDPKDDGREGLRELEERHGPLPDTLEAVTGTGGSHFYFRYPDDMEVKTFGKVARGVDVRGYHGFAVAPGSPHVLGTTYEWDVRCEDLAPVDAPAWLLELVKREPEREHERVLPATPTDETSRYGQRAIDSECAKVRAAEVGNRNNTLFQSSAALGELIAGGEIAEPDAFHALLLAALDANGQGQPNGREELSKTIRSGFHSGGQNPRRRPPRSGGGNGADEPPEGGPPPGPYDDDRPVIPIVKNGLTGMAMAMERAIFDLSARVFHRDGAIVAVDRGRTGFIIRQMPKHRLRGLADKAARWTTEKHNRQGEVYVVRADAPMHVTELLLEFGRWRTLQELLGVTECPAIRADGSVIDRPGYDDATGLLYDPCGVVFPPVTTQPDPLAAGLRALDTLREVVNEYPFGSDAHESVALAGFLTAVARPVLDMAPMFLFASHSAGSGKTILTRAICNVAVGLPVAPQPMTREEEFEKRLTTSIMEGERFIIVDNLDGTLRSASLEVALTSPYWTGRVMGFNKMARYPQRTMFMGTGNNIALGGDMFRRCLHCYIDRKEESPHRVKHRKDLDTWVPANRPRLVVACLTIMKAYYDAGCPDVPGKPLGSYGMWDQMVRRPLLWLECADPVDTQDELREADGQRELLADLLAAWHAVYADAWCYLEPLVEELSESEGPNAQAHKRLRTALRDLCRGKDPSKVSLQSLGARLGKIAKAVHGGYRLERAPHRGPLGYQWRVAPAR